MAGRAVRPMTPADYRLVLSAIIGIALSIALIIRGRLHPFVGLLCGAFTVGLLAGLPMKETAEAVEKGAGAILGGTGLVVALGLGLGAMLQLSDGAGGLARAALRISGVRGAPWASLGTALVIGLPLFFETGLVLLLPIVASAAAALPSGQNGDAAKLRLMLPALAGLSVVHALVPPHPGPLLAVDVLDASLGRTLLYGLIVGIPTAIIAGPLLARFTAPGVKLSEPLLEPIKIDVPTPSVGRALTAVLLPVALITAGQVAALLPPAVAPHFQWLGWVSHPVVALLVAVLVALPLLFGRRITDRTIQGAIWTEAMTPAGGILLAIGAGGALKQVLVTAGLSDLLVRVAGDGAISPLLLAWGVSVCIRLATGSATVATITTAGVMQGLVATSGVDPEWVVLAIGAGSLFFSHVNDPGFWLVKSYLGTDMPGTFKTWSIMETVVAVVGLLLVLAASSIL
ncbi:gluconate permease [Sphingobium ummariense RL-3]|uniref:Gluconate permease n=2 Tax=Sphingobium TaxID=165695 RepID=T0J8P1_9SPHN|nr:gluconate permease [Sphingobium ummariense RL-3]